MKFIELELNGAFIIEIEKFVDERGFFARTFDLKQFKEKGLESNIIQCNTSFSEKKGTLRGLHYQVEPFQETKIVMCAKGKILDVIIDIRKESKTFGKWTSIELNDQNSKIIYIPKGFAHGFQTLENDSQVIYQNSQIHKPEYEKGIRWNDPYFEIKWSLEEKIISAKDESWINFEDQ
jgi:dTDP-4-dehydrorhamnose 3,5-epimerase